jgi:TonB-linked SusC/RagA family outer membrane protein
MYKKITCLFLLIYGFCNSSSAQTNNIKGRINDSTGNSIVGATISTINKKSTTSSTKDGFILRLKNIPDTLIISHIGYEPQSVIVNDTSFLIIKMLKRNVNNLLDVTINTGYQKLPRERATGSFTVINNDVLNHQVGNNILDRLKGVTNGLLFDEEKARLNGKKINFNIRGLSSINGNKDPLIVLDNFPYEGDINNINPNDVESITILKDAAAASIWGTKAGNGVVVITTKSGSFNNPLSVNVNSTISYTPKPDLFTIDRMTVPDYIDFERTLYDKGYFNAIIKNYAYTALTPVVDILNKQKNGELTNEEAEMQIQALKAYDNRKDLEKYLYNNAVNQQYSLNLNGGNKKEAYFLSLGVDNNLGNLGSKFNRITGNVKNDFKPFKFLSFSTNITYTQVKTSPGIAIGPITKIAFRDAPYARLANENGDALAVDANYRGSYTDTAGNGKLLNWKYFPLNDYTHTHYNNLEKSIRANLGAELTIMKGLVMNLKYQYEWQNSTDATFYDPSSFYVRDLVNRFSSIDPETGLVVYNLPNGGILHNVNSFVESKNYRGQFNLDRDIKQFKIDAILGAEIRKIKTRSDEFTAYGYNENNLTSSGVNENIGYRSFLGNTMEYIDNSKSFTGLQNNYVSYFGNAAVSYLNKYIVSGSARRDASNLFGVNINDKWNPFWSAGLAWNINREKFFNLDFVDYLKLRTTLGVSGNVDQSKSAVTVISSIGVIMPNYLPSSMIAQYANPELGWEKVRTLNLGLDYAILNNTFAGSFEYYVKHGYNLFGPSIIDPTTGVNGSISRNIADMIGKGVDLSIKANLLKRKLSWTANINVNYYADKVSKYYLIRAGASTYIGRDNTIAPMEGAPLYSVGGYKWAGLDHETGNPIGYLNGVPSMAYDSIISQSDLSGVVYKGAATPKWYGSLGNIFTWKNFSLNFNLLYQFGHYFRKNITNYNQLVNGSLMGSEYADRWQAPGDEKHTNIPSFVYPVDNRRSTFYTMSELFVDRADIIRFQFLNLSYMLKSMNKNKIFKDIVFNININNIGILWTANKWDIDPQNQRSYKTPRTLSFKMNIHF